MQVSVSSSAGRASDRDGRASLWERFSSFIAGFGGITAGFVGVTAVCAGRIAAFGSVPETRAGLVTVGAGFRSTRDELSAALRIRFARVRQESRKSGDASRTR